MNSIALCWIGIGNYNILFNTFYESFKEKFCKNEKINFIVFTDKPEITKDKYDCITYTISNPCYNKGYILFRKFKYLLMAEDIFLKYDYVAFMNGNCVCKESILLDDIIDKNKPITCISHPGDMIKTGTMYDEKSTASFRIDGDWLYKQAGVFIMPSLEFLRFANTIESWRMTDKITGGDKYLMTHDECYVNRYYYENRNILNVLDGKIYACPSDYNGYYQNCKITCLRKEIIFRQNGLQYISPFPQDLYSLK